MKTTVRYHLTLVRMAIIKKSTNNKCWKGYGEKGTLQHCWWECKLIKPLWRTVWMFFKNSIFNIQLPYDPVIPFLGIYLEKTIVWKDICTLMFTAALFTIANTWKQPKCPLIEEWIKVWFIYTMEYYSTIKRNEIMSFTTTWMDLESVILSEVSRVEKDKYHMILLIYGIWKNDTIELTYKTEIDSQT